MNAAYHSTLFQFMCLVFIFVAPVVAAMSAHRWPTNPPTGDA